MRDVILARKGGKVKTGKVDFGNFSEASTYTPLIVGSIPLPVTRGWLSVEAKVKGESGAASAAKGPKPSKFRFVNTHLEAFGEPTIREAQAKELVAEGGPLDTGKQVILVGDINSGVDKHNIVGDDQLAFQVLLDFGLNDNGATQSCCVDDLVTSGVEEFDHTVDHILTKPKLKTKKAFIVGNEDEDRTPSGLLPADHAGVVSKLTLKK
jgi:endonuclease/exonuclease/phosphatase family metal-dependent hydrolase